MIKVMGYNPLIVVIIFFLSVSVEAGAQITRSTVDILDGVLSNMPHQISFDEVISTMDSEGAALASVEEYMLVNNALDYVSDSYSIQSPTYFSPMQRQIKKPFLKGFAMLPVTGLVTSGYGYREAYKRMHKGVDIRLQVGDTVRSAMDGTIDRIGYETKGYGLFVVIKHSDGLETRYAHLSRALVFPGKEVKAGEAVALGGNSGNSTGPHLHFEVRHYGTAFNPTSMFNFSAEENQIPSGESLAKSRQGINDVFNVKSPIADRSTYVVRQGDTIESVAQRAGISVLTLCRLNMLSSGDKLESGRMLRLR